MSKSVFLDNNCMSSDINGMRVHDWDSRMIGNQYFMR